MLALNSKNVIRKRKRNVNRKSQPQKLISQEKSLSANVQYPAEKYLRLRRVTSARIHRSIESLADSNSAKRSSAARFRKNRRKSFLPEKRPISSKDSSRNADARSRRT